MDRWENNEGEFEALKIQASRVGMLPHRITAVMLSASQGANGQQGNRPQPQLPLNADQDTYPDPDEPL
ncbi:hypothetical protein D9M68_975060 [compost metagenome]